MGIVSKSEANYTPARGDYKTLEPFRYWCQKVLPLVYDDSLSYYELLCKVVDYLNKTMEDVGTLNGDIGSMYTAFKQLQEYVNNYFSTLDVQEEINNKLDEMAKSGYLSSIIAPIVLNVAVPLFVDKVSDMTDHSRIYVLTSTGFVYLWNGTAWYNTGMNYTDNFTQYLLISGTLSNGTDANDITTNGIWNINGSFTYKNLPITTGLLQTFNMSNVTYQLAISGSDYNRGRTFFRRHTDPGWSNWAEYDIHPNSIDEKNTLPNNTNVNDFKDTGVYNINGDNTYPNLPFTTGMLMVINSGKGSCYQIGYSFGSATLGNIYMRRTTTTGWNEWIVINTAFMQYVHGELPSGDLNDITDIGSWNLVVTNTYQNNPSPVSALLEVFTLAGVTYQRVTMNDANNYKVSTFTRTHTLAGWNNWMEYDSVKTTYARDYEPSIGGVKYNKNSITITKFESGYYINQTGKLGKADTYVRSTSLFKVPEFCGFRLKDESITNTVHLVFFDANMNYINYINFTNGDRVPSVSPKGTVYAGLNYNLGGGEVPSEIEIVIVDGSHLLSITNTPVNGTEMYGVMNRVIYNDGSLSAITTNYKTVFIPNPKCTKIFESYNADNNCYCVNSDGNIVTPTDYEQITPTGKLYTIPEDTVLIGLNWRTADDDCYAELIYDNSDYKAFTKMIKAVPLSRLSGKKVCAIGDSITYIDGRAFGNKTRLKGWQTYLRILGAEVQNFGYSGYAYASNSENEGITNSIVDKNVDMSTYDVAILFGGANDIRLSVTMGTDNTDYSSPNIDASTFTGAIGKLIQYLRKQNSQMEIFICTTLPSQATSRTFEKSTNYNNAIKKCADFWNVPLIDTFEKIGVHPNDNFSLYFYDDTHPNTLGCERIGKIIASEVNNYLSIAG